MIWRKKASLTSRENVQFLPKMQNFKKYSDWSKCNAMAAPTITEMTKSWLTDCTWLKTGKGALYFPDRRNNPNNLFLLVMRRLLTIAIQVIPDSHATLCNKNVNSERISSVPWCEFEIICNKNVNSDRIYSVPWEFEIIHKILWSSRTA